MISEHVFPYFFVYVLYHCYFYYCIIVINDIGMIILRLGYSFCCFYGHIILMKTAYVHTSLEIICCVTPGGTLPPAGKILIHHGTDWSFFFFFSCSSFFLSQR